MRTGLFAGIICLSALFAAPARAADPATLYRKAQQDWKAAAKKADQSGLFTGEMDSTKDATLLIKHAQELAVKGLYEQAASELNAAAALVTESMNAGEADLEQAWKDWEAASRKADESGMAQVAGEKGDGIRRNIQDAQAAARKGQTAAACLLVRSALAALQRLELQYAEDLKQAKKDWKETAAKLDPKIMDDRGLIEKDLAYAGQAEARKKEKTERIAEAAVTMQEAVLDLRQAWAAMRTLHYARSAEKIGDDVLAALKKKDAARAKKLLDKLEEQIPLSPRLRYLRYKVTGQLDKDSLFLEWDDGKGFMEFVLIPAGKYVMGTDDGPKWHFRLFHRQPYDSYESYFHFGPTPEAVNPAGPAHEVSIERPFYIARYEVTRGQWQSLMGSEPWTWGNFPRHVENVWPLPEDDENGKVRWRTLVTYNSIYLTDPPPPRGEDYAACNIRYPDATAFLRKLEEKFQKDGDLTVRMRLPSEEEWEYACRAGTTGKFHFGENVEILGGGPRRNRAPWLRWEMLDRYAWRGMENHHSGYYGAGIVYCSTNWWGSAPVGLKRPNAWGLYDMHGNMSEYCSTLMDAYPGADWKLPALTISPPKAPPPERTGRMKEIHAAACDLEIQRMQLIYTAARLIVRGGDDWWHAWGHWGWGPGARQPAQFPGNWHFDESQTGSATRYWGAWRGQWTGWTGYMRGFRPIIRPEHDPHEDLEIKMPPDFLIIHYDPKEVPYLTPETERHGSGQPLFAPGTEGAGAGRVTSTMPAIPSRMPAIPKSPTLTLPAMPALPRMSPVPTLPGAPSVPRMPSVGAGPKPILPKMPEVPKTPPVEEE